MITDSHPPSKVFTYLLFGLAVVCLFVLPCATNSVALAEGSWQYVAAPVGQGDAFLLLNPQGEAAVIDAGTQSSELDYISQVEVEPDTATEIFFDLLDNYGVDEIETLVITHPHYDHISILPELLREYDVQKVWEPDHDHHTRTYNEILHLIDEKNISYRHLSRGDTPEILPGLRVNTINPPSPTPTDLHEACLTFTMDINGVSILHTGDVEEEPTELEWVDQNLIGSDIDVLKVGHHASTTSTGESLLTATDPEVAVIPSPAPDEYSPYGHPEQETLDRLSNFGVDYYITGAGSGDGGDDATTTASGSPLSFSPQAGSSGSGYVEVVVKDSGGEYEITTYEVLATENVSGGQNFRVGPNPFRVSRKSDDELRFQLNDYSEGTKLELGIYTLQGRAIHERTYLNAEPVIGTDFYEISWAGANKLASGHYIYRFKDTNTGNVKSGQLVVKR